MQANEVKDAKRVWEAPEVIVYGDIDTLTQQVKSKTPGASDDFAVSGISNP